MANFFYSAGYNQEVLHTGMISYLCDLYNEGQSEPLRSFLGHLQMPVGAANLLVAREWNDIDLVIFDDQVSTPIAAIEMKVDSHEGLTTKRIAGEVVRDHQTIVYPRLLSENTPFLFVTLGAGECFHAPYGAPRARWVRAREFYEALEAISTTDLYIEKWREAVGNEIDLQERCFSGDRTRIAEYRERVWSLYFLGNLKQRLLTALSGSDIEIDPTVYKQGPTDTILNFGLSKFPAYLEINNNGLLNLKANLEDQQTIEEKEECRERVETYYQGLLQQYQPSLKTRGLDPRAKTKTIMSFDIGLNSQEGKISYATTEQETTSRLSAVVQTFYWNPPPQC